MATQLPPQIDPTPSEHIATLHQLAGHYENAARYFRYGSEPTVNDGPLAALYTKRAAALRWLLSLNALGVDESEVTL